MQERGFLRAPPLPGNGNLKARGGRPRGSPSLTQVFHSPHQATGPQQMLRGGDRWVSFAGVGSRKEQRDVDCRHVSLRSIA
ncbi:hypothetical protein BHE74_00022836 [Ensete ventricosum]|nr:hypothetical protein GW17_00057450 [Ensete ventricosum]RWW69554.1 hypothetical protein BHE74_00022836 [Ensete ventricosum]